MKNRDFETVNEFFLEFISLKNLKLIIAKKRVIFPLHDENEKINDENLIKKFADVLKHAISYKS